MNSGSGRFREKVHVRPTDIMKKMGLYRNAMKSVHIIYEILESHVIEFLHKNKIHVYQNGSRGPDHSFSLVRTNQVYL